MAVSGRQRLIRQALEEMVTCPMCRGRLQQPRLLRCRHSACLQCLINWHQASTAHLLDDKTRAEETDRVTVSCPTCRALTFLPPGTSGVDALPGDFNKNILLDILDTTVQGGTLASSRTYCTVCDITGRRSGPTGGTKTPATAFCNQCRDHLCAPCLEEHNAMPLLEEHDVSITPHGSHLSVLMCRDHRNKSLDFFCHNCSKLICSICLRTAHREHLAEGADDVSESRKRDILAHKRAMMVRLAALKADGRAFNIDRRASAKQRVASFSSQRKNSFDVVSAVATLESLVQFCEYLLTQADPGEVVAAADHVRTRTETLLAETAQDDFTDRIIALLCRAKPEPVVPPTPNPSRNGGAGSLTSDDRSSDVTDDASFIGSDPGGVVTDLEDNLEELLEEEEDEVLELERDALRAEAEGEGQTTTDASGRPGADDDLSLRTSRSSVKEPRSDVSGDSISLLWRCSMNGPDVGQVDGPWDVSFTQNADVIITEAVNNRVQLFTNQGRESRVLMSGFEPRGVTVAPDGTIAVVDHTRHCVRLLPPGAEQEVAWKPAEVAAPEVLAYAPNGYRVVTDAGKHVVAVYNADGEHLHTIGERGHGNGQFRQPLYVSVSSKGKVVVGDLHNNRIQAFTLDGKYLGKAGKRGSGDGNLYYPRGVCWDGSDHVVVADSNNSRVTVFDHDGRWMRHMLTDQQGMRKTRGVSVTPSGETLVAVTDRDNEYSSLTVWKVHA